MLDFNTPEKHQKSWCFLMFLGDIKVEHCLKMGQPISPRGSSKKLVKICWIASNVVMKASAVRILNNIFSFGIRYLRDRL